MSTITIPGKVFVIGEYSVLQGGRGLFAALRPGYRFQLASGDGHPHPDSPLGRYAKEVGKDFSVSLDKSSMTWGFGSSTAELIAGVMHDLERLPETKRLWAWYVEQFPKTSGADLAVQMEALRTKRPILEFDHGDVVSFPYADVLSRVYVFQIHSEQKLKTHEALKAEIPKLDVSALDQMVAEIKSGFESGLVEKLSALNTYADNLHAHGLETPFAYEVRLAFQKQDGVLSVKGCGAGMNDVFLVATRDDFSETKNLPALLAVSKQFQLLPLGNLKELLW